MTPTNVFWIRPRRHNVGNETIAYALRRLLRAELGSDVNLLPVAATSGEYDGWLSGLTAQTIHEMNLYGHGVVIGGGNVYENGGLDVDVERAARAATSADALLALRRPHLRRPRAIASPHRRDAHARRAGAR